MNFSAETLISIECFHTLNQVTRDNHIHRQFIEMIAFSSARIQHTNFIKSMQISGTDFFWTSTHQPSVGS